MKNSRLEAHPIHGWEDVTLSRVIDLQPMKLMVIPLCLLFLASYVTASAVGISPGKKTVTVAVNEESLAFFYISNGGSEEAYLTVSTSNPSIAKPIKWCYEGKYDDCRTINGAIPLESHKGRVIMVKILALSEGTYTVNIDATVSSNPSSGNSISNSVSGVLTIISGAGGKSITEEDIITKSNLTTPTTPLNNPSDSPNSENPCGDGLCDIFEDISSCPADCGTNSTGSSNTGLIVVGAGALVGGAALLRHLTN